MSTYVAPEFNKTAFNCPLCGAYAQQHWFKAAKGKRGAVAKASMTTVVGVQNLFSDVPGIHVSVCAHCDGHTLWHFPEGQTLSKHNLRSLARMVYPESTSAPLPSQDLPEDIRSNYNEARSIVSKSPRGAAALLRVCVQQLCVHLDQPGANLNADIGKLVELGLPQKIQQALDTVRVVGNNAVHPGELDLRDDLDTASKLFELVNLIADVMITQPAKIKSTYDRVMSPAQKDQIRKPDTEE